MKKHIYTHRLVLLILSVFTLSSCSDDFLNQVNPNGVTSDIFWKNNNDFDLALSSLYSSLQNENVLGIKNESYRTDIGVPNQFRQSAARTDEMYFQIFDGNTAYVENKWNALYLGVFRANQIIQNYPKYSTTLTTEVAKESGLRILAQARAIRGLFYYLLNNSYGDVPVLDFVPKDFSEFQQAFSTSDAVKDFYREDLRFGIENLPETYTEWANVGQRNVGRITAGACEAFLAKSYVLENNFTEAKPLLLNVMQNYDYSLTNSIGGCTTGINEFTSESIFEVNYTVNFNFIDNGEELLAQNVTHTIANANTQPASNLVIKYRNDKPDSASPANAITRNIYAENGDVESTEETTRVFSLRMEACIGQVDDSDGLIYGVSNGELGNEQGVTPYGRNRPNVFKKFTHWNTISGGVGEDDSSDFNNKSGINLPMMRLAEIYLLYAECMIEDGNLSEALRYINKVRERSHVVLLGKSSEAGAEFVDLEHTYMDDIDLDVTNGETEVTLDNLKDHLRFVEMPLELCLEGDRAADLRRWGVFKSYLQELASIDYDYYHYPRNINGKHGTRFKSYIHERKNNNLGEIITPYYFDLLRAGEQRIFDTPPEVQDCRPGAVNFTNELHAYLPIPQAEIDTNLKWNIRK